jgi:hypothetical protein
VQCEDRGNGARPRHAPILHQRRAELNSDWIQGLRSQVIGERKQKLTVGFSRDQGYKQSNDARVAKSGKHANPIQPLQFSSEAFSLRKQNINKVPFCMESKAEGCLGGLLYRLQRGDTDHAVG